MLYLELKALKHRFKTTTLDKKGGWVNALQASRAFAAPRGENSYATSSEIPGCQTASTADRKKRLKKSIISLLITLCYVKTDDTHNSRYLDCWHSPTTACGLTETEWCSTSLLFPLKSAETEANTHKEINAINSWHCLICIENDNPINKRWGAEWGVAR